MKTNKPRTELTINKMKTDLDILDTILNDLHKWSQQDIKDCPETCDNTYNGGMREAHAQVAYIMQRACPEPEPNYIAEWLQIYYKQFLLHRP